MKAIIADTSSNCIHSTGTSDQLVVSWWLRCFFLVIFLLFYLPCFYFLFPFFLLDVDCTH